MSKKISQGLFRQDVKDTFRYAVDDIKAARMGILYNSKTFDHTAAADAVGETVVVNVPGAKLGDFVFASLGVSQNGVILSPYIQADDLVEVRVQNESGSTRDLASTTLRVFVVPVRNIRHVFGEDALFATAAVNVSATSDAVGVTSAVTVTGAALGDYAFCSLAIDMEDLLISCYVSATNTVEIRVQNESGTSTDLASATARVVVVPAGSLYKAFSGIVKTGTATFDQTAVADGGNEITTVTVAGAHLGDYVFGSIALDGEDMIINGYVSAQDTVSFIFQNESASTRNIASTTLRACVIPQEYITNAVGYVLQK